MTAPLYGGSVAAPVSSAPDVPSRSSSDYQNPVQDINRSYDKLQDSLTVDNTVLLGKVSDTVAGATDVTNVDYDPTGPLPSGEEGLLPDERGMQGDPFPVVGTKPSKDYTTRHNQAVGVAIQRIRDQVRARGGNPDDVRPGLRIAEGSKKKNGNNGYADIYYDDGKTMWIWEVKSAGQAAKAIPEAAWYVQQYNKDPNRKSIAQPGWSIGPPVFAPNGDRVIGIGSGGIIYYGDQLPRRSPTPVPVPVPVPIPIYVPAPEPKPITDRPFNYEPPPAPVVGIGAILIGGAMCLTGALCEVGIPVIGGGIGRLVGGGS